MKQHRLMLLASKKGFTLIEMSIVLVIIGLIVGGILVGQDLINGATVRAQIAQIEKYNSAVNTFKNKYGGVPGDLLLTTASQFGFITAGCTGGASKRDGNGLIDAGNTTAESGASIVSWGEPALFWADLGSTELIEGSYNTVSCNATTPALSLTGFFMPPAKIGNGNYIYVYAYNNTNFFGLSQIMGWGASAWEYSAPGITVNQATAIDRKVDDGNPTTGSVVANYVSGQVNGGWCNVGDAGNVIFHNDTCTSPNTTIAGGTASSCYDTTTNTYSTSINGGNGQNCALSFRFQ